jgi:hypothetical protein
MMREVCIRKFRAGYSFAEVMFAVVILGIGFIMIAAIFPAALQQSKTTSEETSAATLGRAAVQYLSQAGQTMPPLMPQFPPDGVRGKVRSVHNPQNSGTTALPNFALWDAARGDQISTSDPRLGWVGFYKRDPGASVAQVIVITCEIRNRSVYSPDVTAPGLDTPPDPAFANLQGRPVLLNVDRTFNPPRAVLSEDPACVGGINAAVEGAYIVIASDNLGGPNDGIFNGHVFRLGALIGKTTASLPEYIFEFAAGNEYVADSGPNGENDNGGGDDINLPRPADPPAGAFIVGRALIGGDGTAASPAIFEGLAQDISVYTRFISVR